MMNLDELQQEVERVLALLKNREPGLITWNEALWNRLLTIKKMVEEAGI